MIHVLSIIHYPIYGGPHNRNAQIAPPLKDKGFKTTVLLPDETGNAAPRLQQAGVDIVKISLVRIRAKINPLYHLKLFFRFWGDVQRIRRVIREFSVDVVQLNGLVNPQGAIAARLEGVRVVWQILDTYPPMLLRRAIMPIVKLLANVVMCTGQRVAEDHPGSLEFGDRLVLFYPPVNLGRFTQSPDRRNFARQKLNLTQKAFVIGTVGNINPQKGHLTFIRAAALLKKEIPDAYFVILGALYEDHQEYAEGLWREASALNLTMGVDLIVLDPGLEVAELEAAFDIFWMTSEPRSEGVPTAVEEAMSLGIPIVATQTGSISEIVLEDKTGFVVAPYDTEGLVEQTIRLYDDELLKQTMSLAAHDFATINFSVECCMQSHLRAYELALI